MIYTYADLLKEFPIDENESVSDFVKRIPERIIKKYEITTNVKVIADGIRRELKRDRTIKVKRSETLINGNVVSEKFGYVKDVEEPDLNEFDAVKLTTNPYGNDWVRYEKKKLDYFDVKDAIISEMKEYAPIYPKLEYKENGESYLMVIDPADIHIGKLCKAFETNDEYNTEVAVKRVLDGVQGLINKSKGYNIDRILFIIGNDVLHVDSPKRVTTSGTPQDTDGMWYTNFLTAKSVYIKCIELMVQVAPITVHYNPSNHDYTNGFFLADAISTWFRHTDIEFNADISHRKYFSYYNNLIGTTHGDGAKEQDLPLLMAQESRHWTNAKHRYFYTHHIHHKKSKDYGSVCVESLRSPSGTDSWHHRNGYQHQPKAVEAFIHDKENGQIARLTHIF